MYGNIFIGCKSKMLFLSFLESLGTGGFSITGASDGNSDFQIQGASDGNSNFQIQGATDGNSQFQIHGATDGGSQAYVHDYNTNDGQQAHNQGEMLGLEFVLNFRQYNYWIID